MKIDKLDPKSKTADIVAKVNEIAEALSNLPIRDRGPQSTREMTEEDARRVVLGDLKTKPVKEAADELGLSYGQVYSARKGFTFKGVYAEWRASGNDRRHSRPEPAANHH